MGYSYDMRTGKLCCDRCGEHGGVRKRTCTHRVTTADGQSAPYCYPPAYCDRCYAARGGASMHDGCKAAADKRNAEEASKRARLEAGALFVKAAWGDWCETVRKGWVGVYLQGKDSELWVMVPEKAYRGGGDTELDHLRTWSREMGAEAMLWSGPPGEQRTKEALVSLPAPVPAAPAVPAQSELF